MNNYTLLFNHTENNTGLVIEAHDMQDARALAAEEVRSGWTITAIKTESGDVYPFTAPAALPTVKTPTTFTFTSEEMAQLLRALAIVEYQRPEVISIDLGKKLRGITW